MSSHSFNQGQQDSETCLFTMSPQGVTPVIHPGFPHDQEVKHQVKNTEGARFAVFGHPPCSKLLYFNCFNAPLTDAHPGVAKS